MDQDSAFTAALANVYEPMLEGLRLELPSDAGFSLPLLIAPSPEYARAAIRLMIVGQETNHWDRLFR